MVTISAKPPLRRKVIAQHVGDPASKQPVSKEQKHRDRSDSRQNPDVEVFPQPHRSVRQSYLVPRRHVIVRGRFRGRRHPEHPLTYGEVVMHVAQSDHRTPVTHLPESN